MASMDYVPHRIVDAPSRAVSAIYHAGNALKQRPGKDTPERDADGVRPEGAFRAAMDRAVKASGRDRYVKSRESGPMPWHVTLLCDMTEPVMAIDADTAQRAAEAAAARYGNLLGAAGLRVIQVIAEPGESNNNESEG